MPVLARASIPGPVALSGLLSIVVLVVSVVALLGITHLLTGPKNRLAVGKTGIVWLLFGFWLGVLGKELGPMQLIGGGALFTGLVLIVAALAFRFLRKGAPVAEQMEDGPSEEGPALVELRARLGILEAAARWTVAVIVAVATSRAVAMLSKGDAFGDLFNELLEGVPLPWVTMVLAEFHMPVGIACSVLGTGALFLVLLHYRKAWALPTAVAVASLQLAMSEVVAYAWQQPLTNIIEQLGG